MFKNIFKREGLTVIETPVGSRIHVKHGWMYEDGELVFTEKGATNVYEEIQAQADTVDLHAIMQRYENGDKTALDKVQGMYLDMVDLPKSYAEIYDVVSRADTIFNEMPVEIKEKYHNSASEFWKNYGMKEFDDVINAYRSNTYARYGMVDDDPIDTVAVMKEKSDIPVDNKEVINNEQKPE